MLALKIADFTTRLPGPLAGSLLADLGAEVTKVELEGQEDPFSLEGPESAFNHWARQFASNKAKATIPKNDSDALERVLLSSDIVLRPPGKFFDEWETKAPGTLFVTVAGGRGKQKYLHDLNALFLTRSFKLHLQNERDLAPPYLPFAGIVFAQQIALEALAGHMNKQNDPKAGNVTVYLDKTVQKVLDKLWDPELESGGESKFLHNGKYPCYNIYKTKDGGRVALAAVESRFWREFVDLFGLNLSDDERFDASGKTGQTLSKMFLRYTTNEIAKRIGERDICVNAFAL